MRLFVTGTGTDVGKTRLTLALTLALRARGLPVVALKPLETGCDPEPADATALAAACDRPELAHLPGLYRARRPLAPFAATLEGEPAPAWGPLVEAVQAHRDAPNLLVEGAGGLLVPIDAERSIADLAVALEMPLAVVARDGLGVLSDTLATLECVRRRGLEVAAVILRRPAAPDGSTATNIDILRQRSGCLVLPFPHLEGDHELADAGEAILGSLEVCR
ncbi:MAG: dethiobiotin synthase [Myxococcales bacterium]|nr:dethiobiotin synthase [Myxococcales bacterium]